MEFTDYWLEIHEKYSKNIPTYNDWLDKYSKLFKNTKTKILDLGCGLSNDALYLVEKGCKVVTCDCSEVAIKSINKHIPQAEI